MAESEGAEVVVFYVSDYAEALPSSFTEQVSIHPRFETVDKFINNHKKKIHEFLVKNFSDLVTKVKVHAHFRQLWKVSGSKNLFYLFHIKKILAPPPFF